MLLGLGHISAQEKKARIAVLDFSAGTGISQADIDGLSSIFNNYFRPNPQYAVVERTRVSRILEEQNIQTASMTEKQRVKLGELLNVSVIVIGDVNIVFNQYNVDVRAVNVQTGEIIAKEGIEIKRTASYREAMKLLAERISPKIPVVYLKTEPKLAPKPAVAKANNDPFYKPTGEYLRCLVSFTDIPFSIAYDYQLTPTLMIGAGTGLGTGYSSYLGYSYWDDGYLRYVEGALGIPIYLETELRTPRYKWSLFVNMKLGAYIFLNKESAHNYKPLLASLSVGSSWKNLNIGLGITTGFGISAAEIRPSFITSISYNLPLETIKKTIKKTLF